MSSLKDYVYCPFCTATLGIVLEEGRERKFCSQCKWTYYPKPDIAVAAVAIRKTDNKTYALMVKRRRDPFKGTWMFPAGFLEKGEHPEQALARELKEETGLKIVRSSLIKIVLAISDSRSPNHLVLFYEVGVDGNIKNNDIDENSDIEWKYVYDEIEIGFPHHELIFRQIGSEES